MRSYPRNDRNLPDDADAARSALRFAAFVVLGLVPLVCAAEKFVFLGAQPDGGEIFVQASPPALRADGKTQGWFRTLPVAPQRVTDQFGFERQYADFIALNVAACATRVMGVASVHYRDDAGTAVARFELPANEIQYRKVQPGTLGENMLTWLCSPRPPPAPLPPARLPPSAARQTPFK